MEDTSIEIRPAGNKGRGLFAVSHFNEGDILFEEVPMVSCQFAWNEDYKYKACEYCMRALETAEENARRLAMQEGIRLPYPEKCNVDKTKHVVCEFCSVSYCSEECRLTAWNKYHMTLCLRTINKDKNHPLVQLKETWKSLHYPPETATIMVCAKMVATIGQAANKEAALSALLQLCSRSKGTRADEEYLVKLLGVKSMSQINILMAVFFAAVNMSNCEQLASPEGFFRLISIVAMNGQGIGTSALGDWNTNLRNYLANTDLPADECAAVTAFIDDLYEQFDNTVGDFLDNEGTGLYALQSACNHSCIPNAKIVFPHGNHQLALQAVTAIAPGEEICISYLDECAVSRSRHSRHKILSGNYQFICQCSKCESEADDPDETSEEEEEDDEEEA